MDPDLKTSKRRRMGFGENVISKNLAFVFFIAFLGVIYIFNSHYAYYVSYCILSVYTSSG